MYLIEKLSETIYLHLTLLKSRTPGQGWLQGGNLVTQIKQEMENLDQISSKWLLGLRLHIGSLRSHYVRTLGLSSS